MNRALLGLMVCLVGGGIAGSAVAGPIHDAARSGDDARLAELVAVDPSAIDERNAEGMTALHLAALGRDAGGVLMLLEAGADAAVRDGRGRTALHYAAMSANTGAIKPLLDAGVDIAGRDDNAETALHIAGRRLRVKTARLLVEAGADPNAVNDAGATPLLLSVDIGHHSEELDAQITRFAGALLDLGADPNIADGEGYTVLGRARSRGHTLAGEMLEERGADLGGDPGDHHHHLRAYRTYAEIEQILLDAEANFPAIARRVPLGTSVLGRNITALKITDNPDVQEDEPEFRYISTMHGDEIIGNEMCLFLIDHILTSYGSDPRIDALVDETEIWIVPLMNPDGYIAGTRVNDNGVDLNRAFPDPYTDPTNTTAGREPEVAAIMDWSWANSFNLGANLHGGIVLVNYPYDNNPSGSSVYTASPDDALYIYISEEYSRHNLPMWNSSSFFHGITNGADWFAISGGLQDWAYRYNGGLEVLVELNVPKGPPASQIPQYWAENQESMLSYMETVHIGVRGIVTDAVSGAPLDATVTVVGNAHDMFTDPDVGDYHRMLLPGTYDLLFTAPGYDPELVQGVVVNAGAAIRVDVALGAAPVVTAPNGGETLNTGSPASVTWNGSASGEFQVQQTANFGDISAFSDGYESASITAPYATGGNALWSASTSDANTGSWSASAGSITHNQESWLTYPVTGPATISFWHRVSSESSFDFLRFEIDGNQELAISGSTGWQEHTTSVGPGVHTLRWSYTKDGSVSSGSDTGWIDDLEITSDGTVWSDIDPLTSAGASSAPWTPSIETADAKVRVRTVVGAGVFGDWDESDAVFAVVSGCVADVTTAGAGSGDPGFGVPDGSVTAADLSYFVNLWIAQDLGADVTTQGAGSGDPGFGVPDGIITAADLTFFVNAWIVGCP